MKFKLGIREIVAMGIGTALFVVLTTVQIPVFIVPNTFLQPRMAVLAFFSAAFGPIVGAVIGIVGHALGDAIYYSSVWWSWVFPEAIVGLCIGLFMKQFAVKEGGFAVTRNIILFNVIQIIGNAFAWCLLAPVLDILVYAEPVNKVFSQGAVAFVLNIVIIGILGTLLLVGYSQIIGKRSGLKAED